MGEIIFMAIVAVIALIMFWLTGKFPVSIIDKSGGAALFPRIIIGLLLFFMIIRVVIVLRDEEKRKKAFVFLEVFKGSRLVYLLGTILYVALIKQVGFVIMTIAYLTGMTHYLHYKQKDKCIPLIKSSIIFVITVAVAVGIYLFFTSVLNIRLPQGILTWI